MTKNNALPKRLAPQFIRDLFHESQYHTDCDPWFDCLDEEFGEIHLDEGPILTRWNTMSTRERGLWLTGKLWNDTGIMPRILCMLLDIPQGSSYAQGVRKLREESWQDLQPEHPKAT